jgi:hypothetical protein
MWKKLDEDPRYWVSDNGVVKGVNGKVLSPHVDKDGYATVRIAGKTYRIHRLVATSFIGPKPDGYEIGHRDGDSSNNCVENLKYCTHAENIADKTLHGTIARGQQNGKSRLTDSQVVDIKRRILSGESSASIALDYGVVGGTIDHIKQGRTWRHI